MKLLELLSDDRAVKDEVRAHGSKNLKALVRLLSKKKNPKAGDKEDPIGDGPGDMSTNDDDEQRRSDAAKAW